MSDTRKDKIERVLGIYTRLMNGNTVSKAEEAMRYGVDERSIRRDIDDIREYLERHYEETGLYTTIVYDRKEKGYRLEDTNIMKLTNSEILAICKILLDSRAFTKEEMTGVLRRLINGCVPKSERKLVTDLILDESFHYVEPRHKTPFIGTLWNIGQAVRNYRYIEIDYTRTKDRSVVTRKLKPVAIMFSEYYFYLAAFIDDEEVRQDFDVINDSFPTIYRVDRIKALRVLDEKFNIPYRDRFEEGEFRKRIQFMYGGRLQKVRFTYSGADVDAILDRLPTAQITDEDDGVYTITAEVFGRGIGMWLRSQGSFVKVLEPKELVDEMRTEIGKAETLYS